MVTASVSLMPEITRAVGVMRVLVAEFGLGRPFGAPNDGAAQTRVVRALLALCLRTDLPVLETFSAARTAP